MAKRFQPRPEPTTWLNEAEFDSEWNRLGEPLKRESHGINWEYILPPESREYLSSVTNEMAYAMRDEFRDARARALADRALMSDPVFLEAAKLLSVRMDWIGVAMNRSQALKGSVGERYRECSLESFKLADDKDARNKQTQIVAQMSDLIDNMPAAIDRGASLFIFGPVGSGKDHLLTAAMLRAVRCGYTVKWFNGMDLYGSFRDSMDEDKSESSQLRPLIAADVLALSDPIPPVGEVTPYQRSMLFRVIDRRYRDRKPTWVTANVATRAEADQRFGAQLVDRITDGALRLQCNWPSHRADRKWTNEQGG